MFVVVFLNGIKLYVPVVEHWIFDVDEESLKTMAQTQTEMYEFFFDHWHNQ